MTETRTPPHVSNALLILFPCYNTLDVNGPLEVLRKSGMSKIFKKITIASETDPTESVEGALLQRNIPLDQDLINDLDKYDLLIVPGGESTHVLVQAKNTNSLFMKLIQKFYSLPVSKTPDQPPRILMSICTGALFLSKLGIFNDRYCTTHHSIYAVLANSNDIAAAAADPPTKPGTVLPARYVDSGEHEGRIRLISSGGISCGIDASLHVVGLRSGGSQEPMTTAEILDYAWRVTDGVTFGENFTISPKELKQMHHKELKLEQKLEQEQKQGQKLHYTD